MRLSGLSFEAESLSGNTPTSSLVTLGTRHHLWGGGGGGYNTGGGGGQVKFYLYEKGKTEKSFRHAEGGGGAQTALRVDLVRELAVLGTPKGGGGAQFS